MEGKVIKEESVGSPCSPLVSNIPSGKENRRVSSPLNTSEILTRSRSKVLSKENLHHSCHHRMSESPKACGGPSGGGGGSGRQSPSMPAVKSSSSPSHPSSHSFGHQFSSPHSTTTTTSSSVGNNGTCSTGRIGRTPSPPSANGSTTNTNNNNINNSGSSSGRTPSSSSNSSGSSREGLNLLSGPGTARHIVKIKRFLGTLLHFGCDISPEVGDRVRTLVFNLVSGHLSVEEFHHSLQEVTSFPLRPFVLPFLRAHLPILQREISHLARISKQTPLSFIRSNEQVITEAGSSPGEPCDIFHSEASDMGIPGKRKVSESFYENLETPEHSSSTYTSTPKRHHGSMFSPSFFISTGGGGNGGTSTAGVELREYYTSSYPILGVHHGHSHHPETSTQSANPTTNGITKGPEDEWKNIHVMLNCILSMVEKTKRALSILQNRTFHNESESSGGGNSSAWLRRPTFTTIDNSEDFKRHAGEMMAQALRATEDRVAEVKRRAEEAVQEVKRQALVELQRAVAAAEARACETVASERARLERVFLDSRRTPGDTTIHGAPVDPETCWNCGRKAHETCSGCNMARYCSAFCQHKDWEHHHTVCGRHSSLNTTERITVTGASVESKTSHNVQDNNNSPPLNVSNPSPDLSPRSNN